MPSLWRLEVANALQLSVTRGRIDQRYRDASLASLKILPIEVDSETAAQAWEATLQLAVRHKLTLYDAAYLELALRRHLPIATRDDQLADAARAASLVVLSTTSFGLPFPLVVNSHYSRIQFSLPRDGGWPCIGFFRFVP